MSLPVGCVKADTRSGPVRRNLNGAPNRPPKEIRTTSNDRRVIGFRYGGGRRDRAFERRQTTESERALYPALNVARLLVAEMLHGPNALPKELKILAGVLSDEIDKLCFPQRKAEGFKDDYMGDA